MTEIDDLISFLKKKGFRDTLQVLTNTDDFTLDKHDFYNELNKFSYYNSFFRIKEEMVQKGLIDIEQKDDKKIIKLTDKGQEIYNKLVEINEIIQQEEDQIN
jgi:hypothetical protein